MGNVIIILACLFVFFIIVAVAVLAIILTVRNMNKPDKPLAEQPIATQPTYINTAVPTVPDYSKKYQRKYLLTKNEWHEWKKLKAYAEMRGLFVCVKIRLLDLLEPRKGEKDYMSLLGKVQSKHVDFVVCDQNMYVKAIIELDDNSHNQQDRMERDLFVDQILTSVGYTVIRTRSITEYTLANIQ
ncbi:MAG: DUF2726 domain-containing protein [Ruminococcaceae bacterium]|nr:DUF2726 domain-containing protein [Oscillospiraceae bacterium]